MNFWAERWGASLPGIARATLRWLRTPSGAVAVLSSGMLTVAVMIEDLAWTVIPAVVLMVFLFAKLAATEAAGRVALRELMDRSTRHSRDLDRRVSELSESLDASREEARGLAADLGHERAAREHEQREREKVTALGSSLSAHSASLAERLDRAENSIGEANAALHKERSDRSLVIANAVDAHLPVRRILLQMTVHRSGSTRLFDLLRTHPAVRLSPSMEIWRRLELRGRRYPVAFSDVPGSLLPVEIEFGVGATILEVRQPDLPAPDPADRWAVEKAHPQFADFDAPRLAAHVEEIRREGIELMIVHGVRRPLETMWSMFDFKTREPSWYSWLDPIDIPQWILRSLESIRQLHELCGGLVVDYEDLPDGESLRKLAIALAPAWTDTEVNEWLAFAIPEVDPSNRAQRPGAGFMGERGARREPGGPDGAWADLGDVIEAADVIYEQLLSSGRDA